MEIGRTSRKGLDVDTPLLRIQSISLECSFLAGEFNLINEFVAAIVARSWVALGVFV